MLPHHTRLDPPRHLHLLAIIVESVRYHGFCAIFVRNHLLGRKSGGVVKLFVIGPVGAAIIFLLGNVMTGFVFSILTFLVATFCGYRYGNVLSSSLDFKRQIIVDSFKVWRTRG